MSVVILDFKRCGEYRGKCADNPAGCHPVRTIDAPSPSSHSFMPDPLSVSTLQIYPGLGQAPDMLNCIPGGLVHISNRTK